MHAPYASRRLGTALFTLCSLVVATAVAGCAATPEEEASEGGGQAVGTTPSACTKETECATTKELSSDRSCVFVVAFDGSGVYSPDVGSNVGVLYTSTHGAAAVGGSRGLSAEVITAETTRAYIEGVPGVPFGASAERVNRGRSAICQHLAVRKSACDIVMLGYSRGAFIANQVAYVLDKYGCADGTNKGTPIKFIGVFDPVSTQMGTEWAGPKGSERWQGSVPPNVESFFQVYKDPKTDPRGGIEGFTLTTSPLNASAARSSCAKPLSRSQHPNGADWHHGEIGHGALPLAATKCALEKAGVRL